jgi:hypothetical protein
MQVPESRRRVKSDPGGKVPSFGIPLVHQRATKLSANSLVQILHIIAEDGAMKHPEVR